MSEKEQTEKTVRRRIFEALARNPDGLTAGKLRRLLKVNATCAILKAECLFGKPRIKRLVPEEDNIRGGYVFTLTARGRKAIEKDTVDSEAPSVANVYGEGSSDW